MSVFGTVFFGLRETLVDVDGAPMLLKYASSFCVDEIPRARGMIQGLIRVDLELRQNNLRGTGVGSFRIISNRGVRILVQRLSNKLLC